MNEETNNLFKQISQILEEYVFCSEPVKNKLNLSLGNEKTIFQGDEYVNLMDKIIEKIENLNEIHLKQMAFKNQEYKNLSLKLEEKEKENDALKSQKKDFEENLKIFYEKQINSFDQKVFIDLKKMFSYKILTRNLLYLQNLTKQKQNIEIIEMILKISFQIRIKYRKKLNLNLWKKLTNCRMIIK